MTDDAPRAQTPTDAADVVAQAVPRPVEPRLQSEAKPDNEGEPGSEAEPDSESSLVTAPASDRAVTVPADLETAEDEPPAKPHKRRLRRALIAVASVVVVLALVVAGAGVWQVRRAFPQYDGVLHLKGLSAPVTVYRDDHAIPQLYAKTADDLFKAQGYVGAQERFWEMDFRRHVTSGRLSEMFGKDQLDTDVYLRTLGWRRVAEQEWSIISPQTRQYLQDYADGVNAYLNGKSPGQVSLEYTVLSLQNSDYTIAKWDPIDSLAWLKAMAWDLRGNMDDEITRATLLASGLSRAQVESLYPAYPYATNKPIVGGGSVVNGLFSGAATTAPLQSVPAGGVSEGEVKALASVKGAIDGIPLGGEKMPGIGSNSWVISGRLTATGKPILANDPHLSTSMPGIWYQMGLHCECPFNVSGFTFSGMPGVVIGHNDRVAWGFTNLSPDVTDLYLEKIRGDEYEVDGVWKPLTTRVETIKVAGGPSKTITVRSTNNGPLLSDADDTLDPLKPANNGYSVSLRWTALDPGHTMDALFALDTARDFTSFREAAALFEVPSQNMVYADVDGNIGYQSPGRIPIRGRGDGRYPALGWDSSYNWTGYIPFNELPYEENPADGFIATANQAVISPTTYQPFLTDDWSYGYRSQRIRDMITSYVSAGHKISTSDVAAMQFDNRNDFAAQITPILLTESVSSQTAKALALLRGWDFTQPTNSAAAAYFNEFWRDLCLKTFDELPKDQLPDGYDRWFTVMTGLMANPTNAWWDIKSTPNVETRDDIVKAALTQAAAQLSKSQGDDVTKWQWGKMHTMLLANQSLGESGIGVVEWLFNYGPEGVPGGNDAVNATGMTLRDDFEANASPSMRMIVDLSDLDKSRWIELTGESGHAFSTHYHDQFELWRTGMNLPMRWDQSTIQHEAKDKLTLTP